MTPQQVDDLVRVLTILQTAYEPHTVTELDGFDTTAYTAGFRAGARSAYMDVICRLRDLKVGVPV